LLRTGIALGISGVLLVAVGVVLYYFQRDMAELRARLVDRSEIVQTPFGAVEYGEIGEGPPVLIVHGSGGGFDQGLETAEPLARSGYRLIAPSRYGYLRSSYPDDPTPAMQADAFAALLDRLDLDDVAVFGGSAGALSAMQFAIRHPDRCNALVLLVPAAHAPTRRPRTGGAEGYFAEAAARAVLGSDFLFWAGVTLAPDLLTRILLATEPAVVKAAGPDEQRRVARILRHILPIRERSRGLWLDGQTAGAPPRYELERITCPVLAISARDDLYGTAEAAEDTAANVLDGRAIIYPIGGHILAGRHDDAWREIAAFLDRHRR
jgi:2-hydroxy-6-oxonona-2,4-dienedioate hydrolase